MHFIPSADEGLLEVLNKGVTHCGLSPNSGRTSQDGLKQGEIVGLINLDAPEITQAIDRKPNLRMKIG